MIGLFSLCAVCGEPLSQTAQSYIPGFREGKGKNIKQVGPENSLINKKKSTC